MERGLADVVGEAVIEPADIAPRQRLLGWAVHAFSATGAVLAVLALLAVERGDWAEAFVWLLIALVIDGVDGTLARAVSIKQSVPRIDGDVLDLVIDYLNYVFVPTFMIWRLDLLPPTLALTLAGLIQLSSLYVFARRDMKTEDGYFRGFPALWNVVAFYLFMLRPDPEISAAVILFLALISFAPVLVVHPFRVRDFGRLPAVLALLWTLATTGMLVPGLDSRLYSALLALSLGAAALILALGLVRTVRGPAPTQ